MGDAVEWEKQVEIIFDMANEDACCPLECELSLR